jgi:catechol 2,3-dioxygenase-like lactoylglutathione lyase family enzyme
MIGYVTLGTNDMTRAVAFYEPLLAPLGVKRVWKTERGMGWGRDGQPSLGLMKPFDGQPATRGHGTMVALAVDSREKVDPMYKLAMELGAADEGPAGPRGDGFHACGLRDPDGNKLAVFCYG